MKKRTVLSYVCLIAVICSYFFPYVLVQTTTRHIFSGSGGDTFIEYKSGFELLFPLIALPAFLAVSLLFTFARNKAGNIIALVLSWLNAIPVFVIFFGLHFDLDFFASHTSETESGFYALVLAQIILIGLCMYNVKHPSHQTIVQHPEEELSVDDF